MRDEMYCPYSFDLIEQVTQNTSDTDESGRSFMECKFVEKRKFAKCDPQHCGAYDINQDRCCYNEGDGT